MPISTNKVEIRNVFKKRIGIYLGKTNWNGEARLEKDGWDLMPHEW